MATVSVKPKRKVTIRPSMLEDAAAILESNGWTPDVVHRVHLPDPSFPSPEILFEKGGKAMKATIVLGMSGPPKAEVSRGW